MLAMIDCKKRVEGTNNKSVSYMASVEEDGYTYFWGGTFFRFKTPQGLNPPPAGQQPPEEPIVINECQQWYVVRNTWVRSNLFTEIKATAMDPTNLTRQIDDAKDAALQDIQTARDAAVADVSLLPKLLDNGDVLLTTVNTLNSVIDVVNREHHTSIPTISATIWAH